MLHAVRKVQPAESFHLVLEFNSGEYRIVDIRPFIKGPVFEPLKNADFFNQVKVDQDSGTIIWPGEIDLDPDVLYQNSQPHILK